MKCQALFLLKSKKKKKKKKKNSVLSAAVVIDALFKGLILQGICNQVLSFHVKR